MSDILKYAEKIKQLIKDVVQKTESITKKDKIRVILMGTTGVGKSSLTNALSSNGKLTIILGKGRKAILEGNGVLNCNASGTRGININTNDENMVFCDCPGIENSEGFLQEIVNVFAIDLLCSDNNKFKILIVVTEGEIYNRAISVCKTIERLVQIFTDHNQLKNRIGLVITQGNEDLTGEEYADIINDKPSDKMKDIIRFFSLNEDRFFVFPRPSRSDIGKEYKFQDHDRLISFLKRDPTVNTEHQNYNIRHQIGLSEKAILFLINLKRILDEEESDKVKTVTDKINEQFRKEEKLENIKKWIERMDRIENSNVKKANEFAKIIKSNIPDYDQYNDDMQSLTEFKVFDRFFDKVFIDSREQLIREQIQFWAKQSIRELEMRSLLLEKKLDHQLYSQFNYWLTQLMKEQERREREVEKRHRKEMKEQERKQHEAEERHKKEIEEMKEQKRKEEKFKQLEDEERHKKEIEEQEKRESETEERHRKEMKEQERKQSETEERLRKEIEGLLKPKIEIEYRRKVIKKRIWTTHYKKKFLWAEWISGTDYYYETNTECEKRERIIQNNTVWYSIWTKDLQHSKSEKSGNNYSDSELWNYTYSPIYYKDLYSSNPISEEEYFN